ncbi:stage II sporulation protein M [Bacillus songklensis]|uniref:Stage II sporulation protein M n=1 Tax=Bacillus songklensis TaxID=1069116 RepID=A0ABV8B0T3_9BACI
MKKFKQFCLYHVRENSSIYLFATVLFLMGVIFGAIVVNSLNLEQKQDLYFYLNRFFGQVAGGQFVSKHEMFQQSFFHNLKYLGFIWILGISVIGLPVVLVLLFLKGMMVGFTVGFLVNQMKLHGFLLSFVSVLPQNIFLIPAFIVISTVSISFSLKLIRQQFVKGVHDPISAAFLRYSMSIIWMFVFVLAASGFEAYMSPYLMKSVVIFINK